MPIFKLENKINDFDKVDINLCYHLGGMNYFTYKEEQRGYYIHFCPCSVTTYGDGSTCVTKEPMHPRSFKICIKTATRRSDRVMDVLMNTFANQVHKIKDAYEKSNEDAIETVKDVFSWR
jgi:hypothetical protein